jgi:hypothetical protein
VVEYALRHTTRPTGVAEYPLTPAPAPPDKLRRELPITDDLAGEFALLSVAGLRIEIEQALRRFLERRAIPLTACPSIASMMRILKNVDFGPGRLALC